MTRCSWYLLAVVERACKVRPSYAAAVGLEQSRRVSEDNVEMSPKSKRWAKSSELASACGMVCGDDYRFSELAQPCYYVLKPRLLRYGPAIGASMVRFSSRCGQRRVGYMHAEVDGGEIPRREQACIQKSAYSDGFALTQDLFLHRNAEPAYNDSSDQRLVVSITDDFVRS